MLGTLGVHTPSPWTMERPNQLPSSDGSGIWMLADVPGEVFEAIDTDNFYIWVKCSGVGASSNDSLNKSLKTFLSQKFLCKLTLYLYHIFSIEEVNHILSEPFRVIQEVTLQTPSLFVPYFTIEEVNHLLSEPFRVIQTPSLFVPYFTIEEVNHLLSEPLRVIQEVTLQTPSLFVPYFAEITIFENSLYMYHILKDNILQR